MAFNFKSPFSNTTATTSAGGTLFAGFGSTTAPAAASTGFGFGATSSAAPAFGTAAPTAFGAAATTSAPSFGGFGFGTSSAAPAFGVNTTTASTGFGFGSSAATSATPAFSGWKKLKEQRSFLCFGGLSTTSTGFGTGGFGGLSTASTGFGTGGLTGFGGATTGTNTGFGTGAGFGSAGTGAGFGGFGSAAGQAQQQQSAVVQTANVYSAVCAPILFGDERDAIIAKWNQLQAFWGTGRGYHNQQGSFVDFTPDNPFSFFKAVGYNCLPVVRNEDGLVALTFERKMSEVCDNQQAIVDTLQRLVIPNQPTYTLCVEGIRPLIDDKTEMVVYVQQRANTGSTTRIVATDLFGHLNNLKQQLQTQLTISTMIPKTGMSPEQKKLYLDNPPAGIDSRIWEQAKLDNPDPQNMIPVPMVGFTELYNRLKHQEQQTSLHQSRLDLLATDIATLQHKQADVVAKTEQYKRNQIILGHRILKVLVKQEMNRKLGYSIQADDEQLRAKLETIYAELNAPMQFKGRLNELMSQMRMQKQVGSKTEVSYQIEPVVQQEIRQHLKRQQDGLTHLINIIQDDLKELVVIEHGLADSGKMKR